MTALVEREQTDYFHSEIAELEEPMHQLVSQLAENLNSRRYGLLIGDDKSGRIPTRIMREVIDGVYANKGHPPIRTVYLNGGKDPSTFKSLVTEIYRYTPDIARGKPPFPRALLVTEFISNGEAIRNFTHVFKWMNITFDVATVSMNENSSTYRSMKILPMRTKLFYGHTYNGQMSSYDRGPKIYRNYDLPGFFDQSELQYFRDHPEVRERALQPVRETTADIHTLAKRLMHFL